MRKAGIYVFVVLLAMSVAVAQQQQPEDTRVAEPTAQQPDTTTQQPDPVPATPIGETAQMDEQAQALRGCLVRQDGEFALRDQEGNRYRVEGEEQLLAQHENHLVELRGQVTERERPEGVAAPEDEVIGTIRAEDLQHVEATCPDETGAPVQEDQPAEEPVTEEPVTEDPATESPAAETQDDSTLAQDVEEGAREVGREAEDAGATIAQETREAGQAIGQEFDRDADPAAQTQEQQELTRIDDREMALPETASPLPLLMLLGFGSLLAGWLVRRK